MKKARILLILGVWVAILPYLGFPYFWKQVLLTISGLGLVYMAFLFYKIYKSEQKEDRKTFENFSENSDFNQTRVKI